MWQDVLVVDKTAKLETQQLAELTDGLPGHITSSTPSVPCNYKRETINESMDILRCEQQVEDMSTETQQLKPKLLKKINVNAEKWEQARDITAPRDGMKVFWGLCCKMSSSTLIIFREFSLESETRNLEKERWKGKDEKVGASAGNGAECVTAQLVWHTDTLGLL